MQAEIKSVLNADVTRIVKLYRTFEDIKYYDCILSIKILCHTR